MYKVLTSRNGHSQTCSDINNFNKHISLIRYELFLFHVIHTYASILRFPTLHHSLWEIYHSALDFTDIQLAGTSSIIRSKYSSPSYTAMYPHHPQSFPSQGSTYFETGQIKVNKIKEINKYTKVQI